MQYEYAAQLGDELSLRVGDVVTRVERLEGGWWRGCLAGRTGMFPDNFVKGRGGKEFIGYTHYSHYSHYQSQPWAVAPLCK